MNIHTAGRAAARNHIDLNNTKIWATTDFTGVYPVGVAAVVIAPSAETASEILNKRLKDVGLKGDSTPSGMFEIEQKFTNTVILSNGDY